MPAKQNFFFFFCQQRIETKVKQNGMANSRGRQMGVDYIDKRE